MIEKLQEDSFTWHRWRAFNLLAEIGIRACQSISFGYILRRYAIGFYDGESLRCRPKENCYAVMFLKDGVFSWCHLTREEFKTIFILEE